MPGIDSVDVKSWLASGKPSYILDGLEGAVMISITFGVCTDAQLLSSEFCFRL